MSQSEKAKVAIHANGKYVANVRMCGWRTEGWWENASNEKRREQFAFFFNRGDFQTSDINSADLFFDIDDGCLRPEDFFDGITYLDCKVIMVPMPIRITMWLS